MSQRFRTDTLRKNQLHAGATSALLTADERTESLRYFETWPEIIRLALMLYVRFPLSLRNVDDLLQEHGVSVSHETLRYR